MPTANFNLVNDLSDVFRRGTLCTFLYFCNIENLEKKVLDCGAGAKIPPLALFHSFGYETHGIDIADYKISMSKDFQEKHGIDLGIIEGDMRDLPYENDSFSFVYSYNTIFHMRKNDIQKSIEEMRRVLRPNGLMYLNLLSMDDDGYGKGKELGPGEFYQTDRDHKVIHAYFNDNEGDIYFDDMKMLAKQKRVGDLNIKGKMMKYGFIDYIARL